MTNDKTVTISRELARLLYQDTVSCWGLGGNAANQLSVVLADVPAVERQDIVYQVRSHSSSCWEDISGESLYVCAAQPEEYEIRRLYASPPAPVSVVMPDRNDIVRTIAATCYFEAKDSALVAGWTYDYIFNQLVALAKVKELNQ